jgi:hypothetical protein
MWGWLEGIFEWLGDQLGPYLRGIVQNLRRFKWFMVALVGAILAPINWVLNWLAESFRFVREETLSVFTAVQAMQPGQSSTMWNALSGGASLANCVIPLDYMIAMGSLLMGLIVSLGIIRAVFWAIKLIPFKFS